MITHLYIELNGITEEINNLIVDKLYDLATSGDLDETSDLKGRLHTNLGYRYKIDYLNDAYPDLYIDASEYAINFEDPNMLLYLLDKGIGANGMITEAQAAAATSVSDAANSTITKFNEFKYFTNITESKGGFTSGSNGNMYFTDWTALEEIDISNLTTIGHNNGYGYGDTFNRCSSLKKVTASSKLSKLGFRAFSDCSKLVTFTGLTGTIEVWDYAFYGCNKLPASFFSSLSFKLMYSHDNYANNFYGCTLMTSIDIAEGTTVIPPRCFLNCPNLATITFPSTLTTVKDDAFNGCSSLSMALNLPNVTSIKSRAFKGSGVTSVTLSNLTEMYDNYENGCFRDCTSLTTVDLSGSTITSMEGTFFNCTNLTSVTLPNSLDIIGMNCFNNTKLSTIDLKNVTKLKSAALKGSKLTTIDLSNITDMQGWETFLDCTNLASVTFPSTSFDWFSNTVGISADNKYGCFRYCTALTSADLSNAVTLGKSMFRGDTSLTTVTLSASNVTEIPDEFCYQCSNLTSLGEKIKPTRIGDTAFYQCTSLNVNNNIDFSEVTYIGNIALEQTILSGVVNLPECLEFGERPFHQCSGITEIHAPKCTTINRYSGWLSFPNLEVLDLPIIDRLNAILENPKLTTINAPLATKFSTYEDGTLYVGRNPLLSTLNINFLLVTKLGNWCFTLDVGLNGQYLEFPNITEIGAQAFNDTAINFVLSGNSMVTYSNYGVPFNGYTGTVYVPDALLSTYRADSVWSLLPSSQMKGMSELPQS